MCESLHMATNLAIDDRLLNEALKVGGHRTKRATVTEALEEYVRRRRQRKIVELFGTIEFDPGPGKDIREFSKGGHTAVLEWWPTTYATAEAAKAKRELRSYTWSFNVG